MLKTDLCVMTDFNEVIFLIRSVCKILDFIIPCVYHSSPVSIACAQILPQTESVWYVLLTIGVMLEFTRVAQSLSYRCYFLVPHLRINFSCRKSAWKTCQYLAICFFSYTLTNVNATRCKKNSYL